MQSTPLPKAEALLSLGPVPTDTESKTYRRLDVREQEACREHSLREEYTTSAFLQLKELQNEKYS